LCCSREREGRSNIRSQCVNKQTVVEATAKARQRHATHVDERKRGKEGSEREKKPVGKRENDPPNDGPADGEKGGREKRTSEGKE